MLWNIVILVCALVAILTGLGFIISHLLASGRGEQADTVYRVSRGIHGFARKVVGMGRDRFGVNQDAGKSGLKNMVLLTLWDMVEKNLDQWNPALQVKRDFEQLIQSTMQLIVEAQINAERLGSAEAQEYLVECLEDLRTIAARLPQLESIVETKNQIIQIWRDVELIAKAQSFNDSNKSETDSASSAGSAKSYYEILGVASGATLEEIKHAYKNLAALYHPDKYAHLADDMRQEAERRFREINLAHSVLSDRQKRSAYDQSL
ncbi:TPA: hypothetical protein DF272_05985 [Candidatus Falkowbacteria bacterium]|nr:hypothetical protein [Candidatus Falkowbacteria bacterium]